MQATKSYKFNPSYIGQRNDIVNLIADSDRKVLDIGCSIGILGEQIKQRIHAEVVGIELDEQMAIIAKDKLDKVIVGDIEKLNIEDYFVSNYFDCIIFADTLEHMKNPWNVLKKMTIFLNNNGRIIASIPNIIHCSTIATLFFKRYWPYRQRGIHDKSHLRFFTLRNIKELFHYANLRIVKIKRNYRIFENPHPFNRYTKYFTPFFIKDFLTFQYLIVARKDKNLQ